MPATIAHALLAEDVFYKLDKKVQRTIDLKRFYTFAQASDPFMFFYISFNKKGKEIRKLQKIAHTEKTFLFFLNTINYIKDKKYYKDKDTLAFLYGFIAHYILDSTVHPLVVYKTGYFDKNNKSSYKYNGLHTYMETYIDNYLLEKRNLELNFNKYIYTKSFSNNLNDTIDYSFKKTYYKENISIIYFKALKQMKFALNSFRKDTIGIKASIYSFLDKFNSEKTFKFKTISYNLDDFDMYDFLNLNHKTWNYPVDKNIKKNSSFNDLYLESVNKTYYIINNLNDYFFNNKKIDLQFLIKNNSYLTGISCYKKLKQQFFEF